MQIPFLLYLRKQKIGFLIFILFVVAFCVLNAFDGYDFNVYLYTARRLRNFENIYQPPFLKGLQYYYSVFFALVLIPFSYFPPIIPKIIWALLLAFWLYRVWQLSMAYFTISILSEKAKKYWTILAFFLIVRFIMYNFPMLQLTIFLLWATLESLRLFREDKFIKGGILLGLAINIKLLPALFLPYLLYRKELRGFFITILTFIVLLYLPGLFLGIKFNQYLLSEWWQIINPSNSEHTIETDLSAHSLTSLIPVYLTNAPGQLPIKRNFLDLSYNNTLLVLNISRIFFVLLTLVFLRTLPFKKNVSVLKDYWEYTYLFICTPLLFPHQQKYAYIYLFPAIIYLLYYFIVHFQFQKSKEIYFPLGIFILASFFFTPIIGSDIIGRYFYDVLQHFRILTIATILLIPVLLMCPPSKVELLTKNQ
ncbi:glycosyltransferase family 87 protein [Cytophagaceae bacterium DM2B3-1]|uniref:Glycosyltransferase family 87 protein n=1 Tax=Xanthocytophaga flava TaxID=3048013 RepID=A0ABT7CE83_9BACT|nr:glycosyltransferase family 87 protein [Xanthocytophaga flavus]MDJ1492003.1 glycosyltransferase family 87 protein [Xanthocytophaga flavus]